MKNWYIVQSHSSFENKVAQLIKEEAEKAKISEKFEEIKKYFAMLPDGSDIKDEFINFTTAAFSFEDLTHWLKENLFMGSIDVNIMTKVDRTNYFKKEELPSEYNDAHAALRGYANSDLSSSVIFSAICESVLL